MNTRTQFARSPFTVPVSSPGSAPALPVSWRDAVPVLTGEHCLLREVRVDDASMLLPILTAPDVSRFISPPPASVERFAWFIRWSHREREAGRYLALAILPHAAATPVGFLQLRQLEPGFRVAEWGVAMAAQYWGAGLFLDASRLLLDFAFNELGVHRLEARAAVANGRSQAAMLKLGAVQEGVLRQSLTTSDGQRLDQVLWSVLDEDWRQLTRRPELPQVH
jgi:N-acetyltransferase